MSTILDVRDVHTFIGPFHILEGIDVTVQEGEIVALLGRNGAGKTTTLKTILGLTPPRTGDIKFRGESLTRLRPFEIAQQGIGYVPEHRAIFSSLSVDENLRLAERSRGDLDRTRNLIFDLFPDLARLIHLPGAKLSGGQQQMLAVARALVPDNKLLLIDEPSEGLAPVLIEQMMAAITQLSERTTIVIVEQNFIVASRLASKFVIVEEGSTVLSGEMSDLVGDEKTIQKYLGAA